MISLEQTIIGQMIQNVGNNAEKILLNVSEADFTEDIARAIFIAFKKRWKETGSTEFTSAIASLPQAEAIYAYQGYEDMPSTDADAYIDELKKRNTLDNAKAIGARLMSVTDLDEVVTAQQDIFKLSQGSQEVKSVSMSEGLLDFYKRKDQPIKHMKTGFSKLDNYTFIDKGDFVIIGGEQSSGKTAFSLKLAVNMAKQGYKVVYYSFETSNEKIVDRIVTQYCHLDFNNVKRQCLTDEEWITIGEAHEEIAKLDLTVINSAGKTVDWIRAETMRREADVIFIDYLGLINSKGRSRYEMVTNISLDLHTMAQSTGTTVICLSQLRRPNGESREPTMHDLRESGQIEADADLILLLFNDRENKEYWVNIGKNKEGRTGKVAFIFEGRYQDFYEVEDAYEDEQ